MHVEYEISRFITINVCDVTASTHDVSEESSGLATNKQATWLHIAEEISLKYSK
jgi:hypothetical protein